MMIFLTIINVIILVFVVMILFNMINIVTAFEEMIVKFIEQNQEYYKSQKSIADRTNNTVMELKKITGFVNEMKRVVSNLQDLIKSNTMSEHTSKMLLELNRLHSEVNKLSSISSKLNKKE